MNKKIIKYVILLLIIPIIISIIFSFTSDKESNNEYNGLDTPNYTDTEIKEIKNSNIYVYTSVFSLLIISGGVWIYLKKKGEF